jgi:hypothetical protein
LEDAISVIHSFDKDCNKFFCFHLTAKEDPISTYYHLELEGKGGEGRGGASTNIFRGEPVIEEIRLLLHLFQYPQLPF